jgi:hypothetical protein
MTASEKIQGMLRLTQMVFETAAAEVRRQHPGIDEREVFLRTAARHLDRETMIRPMDGTRRASPRERSWAGAEKSRGGFGPHRHILI